MKMQCSTALMARKLEVELILPVTLVISLREVSLLWFVQQMVGVTHSQHVYVSSVKSNNRSVCINDGM